MKRLLMFVVLAALAVAVVWFENRPQTVTIPVETSDTSYEQGYYDDVQVDDTTTTEQETTTTEPQQPEVNFDQPDVTLEAVGAQGDAVTLREVVGQPIGMNDVPTEVGVVLKECPGVTDRDLVVRVDAQVQLKSALEAQVSVDYQTFGHPSVFQFNSGPDCSKGMVDHTLKPGKTNHLIYWVALTNAITPDHPDGDFGGKSWSLDGPNLMLPAMQNTTWRIWGPRVVSCDRLLGTFVKIGVAGISPAEDEDCTSAATESEAIRNR